jgi:DNA-binding transcriptional MerR regulator
MYSIGMLSREYRLSRSTLLYYDQIGLLVASARTQANYRQYSEADRDRLGQICVLREAGVMLDQIKTILDSHGMNEAAVLKERLVEINREIRRLRLKQQLIVAMLQNKQPLDEKLLLDRETLVALLKAAGMKDENLECLHIRFEEEYPDFHQSFLEFLGFTAVEIDQIREFSRVNGK